MPEPGGSECNGEGVIARGKGGQHPSLMSDFAVG